MTSLGLGLGLSFGGRLSGSLNSYVTLPGSGAAYITTPHTADLNLTADMELLFRIYMPDFSPVSNQTLLSKGFTTRRYQVAFDAVSWGMWNGTTYSQQATTILDGNIYWIKLALVSGTLTHSYAPNQSSIPGSWTQIGTPKAWSLGATNTEALSIGAINAGELLNARIYRAIIRFSVNGTTVADFNPNLWTSGSTFVSSDGRTYTLNGTAAITKA